MKTEQVIYADILFLIDTSMDFLALYITAFLLKIRFKSGNAVLAAALGAFFSVVTVIMRSESIILTASVALAMCALAYLGSGFKTFLKSTMVFFAVNMLLGGAMTAVFNLFNTLTDGNRNVLIYGEVSTVGDNMPAILFFAAVGIIFLLVKLFMRMFSASPASAARRAEIDICGKKTGVLLTEDSGCLLCEPISGEPIVFLSEKALMRAADSKTLSALKMGNEYFSGRDRQKYRVAVYSTVNGSDMCVCVRPERLTVEGKECGAWIALGKNLVKEGSDGIIPSSLLR